MSNQPRYLLVWCAALVIAAADITGCHKQMKSKSEQIQAILKDSTSRSLIAQQIAQDPTLFIEMQQRMAQQASADTTGGGICTIMMQRAHADSTLAEHMCTVMAADTMMAAKMRARLGLHTQGAPERVAQRQSPGVHDKTDVIRTPPRRTK